MKRKSLIFKLTSLVLAAAFLLPGATGCVQEESRELPEATDTLTVYTSPDNRGYLERSLYYFNMNYPDVKIDVRTFSHEEDDYNTVLNTELAAGKGPDLILFAEGDFSDLQKTMKSGAFQDISGYIEDDPDFDFSSFNAAAMEFGCYEDKRYFVPLSYNVQYLLTTQEALDEEPTVSGLPTSMELLCEQMSAFGKTYNSNSNRFFTYPLFWYYALPVSGLSIVDYETKTVTVENDDFRRFMEAYKDLYEIDLLKATNNDMPEYVASDTLSIVNRKYQFICGFNWIFSFLEEYAQLSSVETPVYTVVPSAEEKPVGSLMLGAAVNRSSKNKANAYNLLKIMLSEEMQEYGCDDIGIMDGFFNFSVPVRNGVLEKVFQKENRMQIGSSINGSPGSKLIPEETVKEMANDFTDISYISNYIADGTVMTFVTLEMTPYFEGEKSYEECLESLKGRLELYINE